MFQKEVELAFCQKEGYEVERREKALQSGAMV